MFKHLAEAAEAKDFKHVQQLTKKLASFRKAFTLDQAAEIQSLFPLRGEPATNEEVVGKLDLPADGGLEKYQKVLEIQGFLAILCITKKIDEKDFEGALKAAEYTYTHLEESSRRTLDFQKSRVVCYLALSAERLGRLRDLRNFFLKAHRSAALRLETATQATLICCTVRQLLQEKQYGAAAQVVAKTTFPEKAPNN